MSDDSFELYDLKVVVANDGIKPMVCNHKVGDWFALSGENFYLPNDQSFPIYCLAALIPILTAKQRLTNPNDWISTDDKVACPDVNCGGLFIISRTRKRTFYHNQVTATKQKYADEDE